MRVTEQHGYQPILTEPTGLTKRTETFVNFLKTRSPKKAERLTEFQEKLRQIARNPGMAEKAIDLEQLERTPLFEFDEGFTGHPPEEFKPGEEPPFAPMSREQMRLLLASTLPPAMMPFALEHFVFHYDLPEPGEVPPGPRVEVNDDKIHLTFYRNNFITEDIPRSEIKGIVSDDFIEKWAAKVGAKRKTRIVGFVDPSKVTFAMGKIIANMVEPPEDWAEIVNHKFWVTKEKTDKKKGRSGLRRLGKRKKTPEDEIQLHKQWEDFVGLALTAPDIAKQRLPKAWQHYQDEVEKFADVKHDEVALGNLSHAAETQGGALQLKDFNIDKDLRTPEEKIEDQGVTPRLAGYERFIAGLNRFIPFGWKITYSIPEDPDRAEQLAGDDKEIKKLLEMDEEFRDMEYGEILQSYRDFDKRGRSESRRHLLAASQAGEFAEWRIYAWLYKFSKTFREYQGKYIDEDDFRDLQAIYSQSEKVGNRLGTGVLPYEAIPVTPTTQPGAEHYGRRVFLYARKERAKYVKDIEKKVRAKSARALLDASEKSFSQFKDAAGNYIDYNAMYDPSPTGLMVPSGNLAELLGKPMAEEVTTWLNQLGVEKISPDAKAVAMAYFDYYKEVGQKKDKYMKPVAIDTIVHYSNELNRPPQETVNELLAVPASTIARSEDFEYIAERMGTAEETRKGLVGTIRFEAERSRLALKTREGLIGLIDQHNIVIPGQLQRGLGEIIDKTFGAGTEEARQERRNLTHFLHNPKVWETLQLLEQTVTYEGQLRPAFSAEIQETKDLLKEKPELIVGEAISEENLELFTKNGIRLERADIDQINEASTTIELPTLSEEASEEDKEKVKSLTVSNAADRERAAILKEKLAAADAITRERILIEFISQSLKVLDPYLSDSLEDIKLGGNYTDRYEQWLKGPGRIFTAIPLQPVSQQMKAYVAMMNRPATFREGLELKDATVLNLIKGTKYETSVIERTPKKSREQAAEEEEE